MTKKASGFFTPRGLVIVSLVLAIAFVVAVLAGARIMMERTTLTPVAMGPVDAPEAESPECSEYIDSLPDKLGDFHNVGVADPAPAGSGAYRTVSGAELNVRCGVHLPDQYTVLSQTTDAGGSKWFEVKDTTPGSDLHSWYAVGSTPTVAVTGGEESAEHLAALAEPAKSFSGEAPKPKAYPLADIPMVSDSDATPTCSKFLDALPDSFEGYERVERDDAPSRSATYLSTDVAEPIVVRCGADMPESYAPGEQITQVDDVAWFAEPSLAQGSTSGRWYALSHEQIVAVSMPNDAGNAGVDAVTTAISKTMKEEQN